MSADHRGWPLEQVTETIIGGAFRVSNELGVGFLEKVYENAIAIELREAGLSVEQQKSVKVNYRGHVVGDYVIDLLVENQIVVELKHAKSLNDAHLAQSLNYLKATGYKLALVINFGSPRVEVKRVIRSIQQRQ
jgi:GxxExxY protein